MPRPDLRVRARRILTTAVAVAGALLLPIAALAVAAPAMAGGSDAAPPYTVTADGVTLPAGQAFQANGHVNAQVIPIAQYTPGETYRMRGADWTPMQVTRHFDPNNGQPGGAYIGKAYYPFSGAQQQLPAGGYCVVWVQVDGFDEHFGEGGQDPVCTTPPATTPTPSEPTPTAPTPSEPTPSEPTPSEPTPTSPAPSDPTPTDPTPSEPVVVHPQIQDYVGACDAAFVLDNGSSTVPVTYTINGVAYVVPAGSGIHTDADGTRIQPVDGQYVITTDTGRTWTFPARSCVVSPQIQDYVGTCDAAFVLDNGSSTVPVTYTINGVDYVVPAGSGIHTDADGTRIQPINGQYVITTDTGRTWTFPARTCGVDVPTTPTDPTPSDPTPSDPTPSDPSPSDPSPSDPTPSDPSPSDPSPSDPTPSDPSPSDPSPSDPTPSDPTPSNPTPSDPTPSEPGVDVPAVEEPTPVDQPTTPVVIDEPASGEQAAAPQPTTVAAPAPSSAASSAPSLPRTGAEPLLLALLLGGALVAAGVVARRVRR